jgi:hypothetical protein
MVLARAQRRHVAAEEGSTESGWGELLRKMLQALQAAC